MSMGNGSPSAPIRFGPDGLIPSVVQDADTGDVLMVAFMNEAALAATRATGRTHFWSRSRGRLWRKGETSGHEQLVEAIYVNCEQNSLLLKVRQVGAACHEGYPTCYYRRLEADDSLAVVRERVFDPAVVYGVPSTAPNPVDAPAVPPDGLERATRVLYGAFAFLRDNDLTAVSGTSRALRSATDDLAPRVADELRELSGVLDGTHRHADLTADALLEGSQVLYWVVLSALRAGVTWEKLRPDRALATHHEEVPASLAARLLRSEAARWDPLTDRDYEPAARTHAALALIAQACRSVGVSPQRLVDRELAALRERPYLAPYFAVEHDKTTRGG